MAALTAGPGRGLERGEVRQSLGFHYKPCGTLFFLTAQLYCLRSNISLQSQQLSHSPHKRLSIICRSGAFQGAMKTTVNKTESLAGAAAH